MSAAAQATLFAVPSSLAAALEVLLKSYREKLAQPFGSGWWQKTTVRTPDCGRKTTPCRCAFSIGIGIAIGIGSEPCPRSGQDARAPGKASAASDCSVGL